MNNEDVYRNNLSTHLTSRVSGRKFKIIKDWMRYRYHIAMKRRSSRIMGNPLHRMKLYNPNDRKRKHKVIMNRLKRVSSKGVILR